jgi:hypothetical protein
MFQLAKRAASETVSPSGYWLGEQRPPNPLPVIHVDPRLPTGSYHEGPPRP